MFLDKKAKIVYSEQGVAHTSGSKLIEYKRYACY